MRNYGWNQSSKRYKGRNIILIDKVARWHFHVKAGDKPKREQCARTHTDRQTGKANSQKREKHRCWTFTKKPTVAGKVNPQHNYTCWYEQKHGWFWLCNITANARQDTTNPKYEDSHIKFIPKNLKSNWIIRRQAWSNKRLTCVWVETAAVK